MQYLSPMIMKKHTAIAPAGHGRLRAFARSGFMRSVVADVASLMQCSFMSVMIAPLGTMVSVVFTRSVSCWTTHDPVVLSVFRRYHVDLL